MFGYQVTRRIGALLLVFVLAVPARAQSIDEATAAFDRGDHERAAEILKALADRGDAVALLGLGIMYAKRQGVTLDDVQAQKWFILAAANLPSDEDRQRAVAFRETLETLLSPAQLDEAQRLARAWKPK